ncbi:transketolase [Candidatus Merdisoma sp. JLR.KK011]|uniref:transketolase n=1 Tax=Candidatus Merdisoma sp. JLR.KK011 TaxID=3114299 RepID=UPI002FF389D6
MELEYRLTAMAKRMRLKALDMAFHAGKAGAHLGGGLSSIEILAVLYGEIARLDCSNPYWEDRDRILISKAHCVLAYYTALNEAGFITDEELKLFEKNGSDLAGHPLKNIEKGIEYAGGSLGMALSAAAGMAIHAKAVNSKRKIYVLLGDGECEEGSVWEAMMFAANYKLDNLVAVIDWNKLQYDGTIAEVAGLDNLPEKIRAFGWKAVEADGHDIRDMVRAYQEGEPGKPLAILANTVKGKGVSFMEGNPLWHHSELNESLYKQAVAEVQGEERTHAED